MRLKNVLFGVAGAVIAASVLFGTSSTSFAAVQDHMGSGAVEVDVPLPVYDENFVEISSSLSKVYVEPNVAMPALFTAMDYDGQQYRYFWQTQQPNNYPAGSYRIGVNLPVNVVKGPGAYVLTYSGVTGDYDVYNGNELIISLQAVSDIQNRAFFFYVHGMLPMPEEEIPELTPEQISEQAYNQSVENSKREIANCDATSEVYFQGGGTIDDSVIASVASNPDATFLYSFPYNDELITLKITSEAAAACFDPEIKYYGPEWLMAHFPQVENEYIPN